MVFITFQHISSCVQFVFPMNYQTLCEVFAFWVGTQAKRKACLVGILNGKCNNFFFVCLSAHHLKKNIYHDVF